MRLSWLFLSSALLMLAPSVGAQVNTVGGGCTPVNGTPGVPYSVGGGLPQIGNVGFTMAYNPPAFGTRLSFWVLGVCEQSAIDFPVQLGCGGPPCRQMVSFASPPILGGQQVPPGVVLTPLPLPDVQGLVGITVCLQYLSFGEHICSEISQGVSITIMQ